jgi:hypothetical protein
MRPKLAGDHAVATLRILTADSSFATYRKDGSVDFGSRWLSLWNECDHVGGPGRRLLRDARISSL